VGKLAINQLLSHKRKYTKQFLPLVLIHRVCSQFHQIAVDSLLLYF